MSLFITGKIRNKDIPRILNQSISKADITYRTLKYKQQGQIRKLEIITVRILDLNPNSNTLKHN